MSEQNYVIVENEGATIKAWIKGVPIEDSALAQTRRLAALPFVQGVALMPDCHFGNGCTVGSVAAIAGAVPPAIIGVDIGCGMMAAKTLLDAKNVKKEFLPFIRSLIEKAVPHGRTNNGGKGDRGAWFNTPPEISEIWNNEFRDATIDILFSKGHAGAISKNGECHLGTLGTGNHFIEVSVDDKEGAVWVVLHSGSRGFGNRIGQYFTNLAKQKMEQFFVQLPDKELAYLPVGTEEFNAYLKALHLAQKYAWRNREIMMGRVLAAIGSPPAEIIHCYHNYMAEETHFGKKLFITRKGAVRAQTVDLVIIPGSMGARTYIARGLGSRDSFCSCSHGAGRAMGRKAAEKKFTVADHIKATEGIECDKTEAVLDETPGAYKDIDAVMAAQSDLVEPLFTLKQLVCVKGGKE